VLRGRSTGRLDQVLGLQQDPGPNVLASSVPRPAGVTVISFNPGIRAPAGPVRTAHGVRITTATGQVEALAAPAPPVPAVSNFLVEAEVTVAGRPHPFRAAAAVDGGPGGGEIDRFKPVEHEVAPFPRSRRCLTLQAVSAAGPRCSDCPGCGLPGSAGSAGDRR
jgi:hypothetical protein